jgi:hypothetical protein
MATILLGFSRFEQGAKRLFFRNPLPEACFHSPQMRNQKPTIPVTFITIS